MNFPHALELTDKAELSEENNILEGIIRFGWRDSQGVMTSASMWWIWIFVPLSRMW